MQGRLRSHPIVAGRVGVDVMDGEDERVEPVPGKAELDQVITGCIEMTVSSRAVTCYDLDRVAVISGVGAGGT